MITPMKTYVYAAISFVLVVAAVAAAAWEGHLGGGLAAKLRSAVAAYWPAPAALGAPGAGTEAGGELAPGAASAESPEALRARVAALEKQLLRKEGEIAGLERALREFEGFRREMPELKLRAAKVVSRSGEEAVIDAGAEDGVGDGWAVAQGAVLAGTIAQRAAKHSVVLLTASGGSLIPARAGRSRDVCTVRGCGGGMGMAVFYANQTETAPGEPLFTSGLLGRLPPGLLIGNLADYPQPAAGGTLEAPVRLAADLPALERVLVAAPLTPPPVPGAGKKSP